MNNFVTIPTLYTIKQFPLALQSSRISICRIKKSVLSVSLILDLVGPFYLFNFCNLNRPLLIETNPNFDLGPSGTGPNTVQV